MYTNINNILFHGLAGILACIRYNANKCFCKCYSRFNALEQVLQADARSRSWEIKNAEIRAGPVFQARAGTITN